ncbi:MAG: nicotinamide-nucleotide amidohydrolase family protein [Verrucomicrobia bacterium]|nr:nicotinamide-nucleotide amidohydrolase family protein [Verrucomicrobiota bacterium]MBU6446831.1 nicotinamide-nucleotide amidohydrolase family protein [Verrucomicrobiota bacterium]MDE3047418.1 CinA family protein [Verrucomicrobiota bacterium]
MQAEYVRRCSLCLVKEEEVAPLLQELKRMRPDVEMALFPTVGALQIMFQGETEVDSLVDAVQKRFPTFFYGEGSLEEAIHREFIGRKKTLALAESCTGGAVAAHLTALPGASQFLLGSIVAYSNAWKERFLQVSRTTLKQKGAVSRETVMEMVQGLLQETEADFAAAVSGIAGPSGGRPNQPVGTIYIAIGERGKKIDAGVVYAPKERLAAIETAVHFTLGGLWRTLVHKTATFS